MCSEVFGGQVVLEEVQRRDHETESVASEVERVECHESTGYAGRRDDCRNPEANQTREM